MMSSRQKKKLFKKLIVSDNPEDIKVALSIYQGNMKAAFRIMYDMKASLKSLQLPDAATFYEYLKYRDSLLINRIRGIDWGEFFTNVLVGILITGITVCSLTLLYLIITKVGWWITIIFPVLAFFYFVGKIIRK